jgi:large subunit ribosomal protein L7e
MVKFVHEAPETVLKKRDEMTEESIADAMKAEKKKEDSLRNRKRRSAKPPGHFIAEYRNRQQSYGSYKTRVSKTGEPDGRILCVV